MFSRSNMNLVVIMLVNFCHFFCLKKWKGVRRRNRIVNSLHILHLICDVFIDSEYPWGDEVIFYFKTEGCFNNWKIDSNCRFLKVTCIYFLKSNHFLKVMNFMIIIMVISINGSAEHIWKEKNTFLDLVLRCCYMQCYVQCACLAK